MSIDILALKLHERDLEEEWKARYFPNHLPEIERNDEIDYDIEQELRR